MGNLLRKGEKSYLDQAPSNPHPMYMTEEDKIKLKKWEEDRKKTKSKK